MPFFLIKRLLKLSLMSLYPVTIGIGSCIVHIPYFIYPCKYTLRFVEICQSVMLRTYRLYPAVNSSTFSGWKTDEIKKGVYFCLSNHSSMVDVPALPATILGLKAKGVSRIKHLNYFARGAVEAGSLPIDPDLTGFASIKSTLNRTLELFKRGSSVLLFPQGHRYNAFLRPPLTLGLAWYVYEKGFPVIIVLHNLGIIFTKSLFARSTTPGVMRNTPPLPKGMTVDQFRSKVKEIFYEELDWILLETLQNMVSAGDSDKAQELYTLGKKHFSKGNRFLARFYARNAINFYPGFPEAYSLMAKITGDQSQIEIGQAVKAFWTRMKEMAPREGIEPPTQGSSILCSTPELPRQS